MRHLLSLRPESVLPAFLLLALSLFSQNLQGGDTTPLSKRSTAETRTLTRGPFRIMLENSGAFLSSSYDGLTMHGTYMVTAAGLMIAGKERTTGSLHASMGGPYYDFENQPGTIKTVYTGDSSAASDPKDPRFHIYVIAPSDSVGGVNPDYDQWPVDQGAPVGSNGKPLFLGDTEFFYVYNDLVTTGRPTGGLPFGIEVRVLGWWNDKVPLLTNTFYFRFQIINKSIFSFDSIYVGLWADPDIGDRYYYDFVGCDTSMRLLYAYKDVEQVPSPYEISPPSVGILMLDVQPPGGAVGSELFRFVPIARHGYVAYYSDIGPGTSNFDRHMYNYLRGLGFEGQTILDPLTGIPATCFASGDPVTNRGWLPTHSGLSATDFRMMGSSGPSRLAPGDTQTVTAALIVAQGQDRLGSLAQVRFTAEQILAAFTAHTDPSATIEPAWWMEYRPGAWPRAHVSATASGIQSCSMEFFSGDGVPLGVSPMPVPGVFSAIADLAPALKPAFGDIVARTTDGRQIRYRGAFNRLSTAARPEQRSLRITYDQTNGDSVANPGEAVELSMTLFNGNPWTFDSVNVEPSYSSATQPLAAGSFRGLPADAETPISIPLAATIDATAGATGQTSLPYVLRDISWFNRWRDTLRIPVKPLSFVPREVYPIHIAGNATMSPTVSLVNPSAWKEHAYVITFPSVTQVTVVDQTTGDSLIRNQLFDSRYRQFPSEGDASRRVVDGFRVLPGDLSDYGSYTEIREYRGPGGMPIESEEHERSVRLGRNLRSGRPNVSNRYRVSVSYYPDDLGLEVRATRRGSRYYLGQSTVGTLPLAPNRIPIEIWSLQGTIEDTSDDVRRVIILFDTNGDHQLTPGEYFATARGYDYSEPPPESLGYPSWVDLSMKFRPVVEGQPAIPGEGSAIRIYRSIPPAPDDVYIIDPLKATVPAPEGIMLFNNFPNPFNPTTTIKFYLPSKSKVQVTVYDLLGAEIAVLLDEEREAGVQYAFWMGRNGEGRGVASGVYFYRVSTPSMSAVGKMILVR